MQPTTTLHHASIHDPTLVKEGNTYYLFGTHRRFATSTDLVNWSPLENNLTRNPDHVLGNVWRAWPQQPENPDLTGNTWAPEVVFNKHMNKWCMYMSVNGAHYRSVIVLLTANHLNEDWTYVGPVVYSGFNEENVEKTDVPRVLGPHADLTRYHSLTDTRINAIDACVVTEKDAQGQEHWWMSFGSWFGGLWLLELDPHTGLRDYQHTYSTHADVSDTYYGIKLAGGYWNSGEGSFLIHHNDWWYLFISYGELQRTGGYQIRVFRSHNIRGPYADMNGVSPISHEHVDKNWLHCQGLRLMSSYSWHNGAAHSEVAQGHNSVFTDDDGSLYLCYHTRFADLGEHYESRIRELFTTEDGWLVASPFEYVGMHSQLLGKGSFAHVAASHPGIYEVIIHHNDRAFGYLDPSGEASLEQAGGLEKPVCIQIDTAGNLTFLAADPTHRSASVSRTDTADAHAPAKNQADNRSNRADNLELLTTGQGVLLSVANEKDHHPTVCFTGVANNLCIWAAQVA